jgi:hypothetical protein
VGKWGAEADNGRKKEKGEKGRGKRHTLRNQTLHIQDDILHPRIVLGEPGTQHVVAHGLAVQRDGGIAARGVVQVRGGNLSYVVEYAEKRKVG